MIEDLYNRPLAVTPDALRAVVEAMQSGSTAAVAARFGQQAPPTRAGADRVAVLPIRGIITRGGSYGGTSTEEFARWFAQAMGEAAVSAVVLDIDSPGGTYEGTQELGDIIHAARGQKRIVAVTHSRMCSGAYFIGSAAHEVVATPSASVGSIGVYTMHADLSKMLADSGVKVTLVSAGKHKVDGNWFEPLNPQGRQTLQEGVDFVYRQFVGAVARNRGKAPQSVLDGFGQGKVFYAPAALTAGMIDRIATLDQVIAGLSNPAASAPTLAAPTLAGGWPLSVSLPCPPEEALATVKQLATQAERERCFQITELACASGRPELALRACVDGTTFERFRGELLATFPRLHQERSSMIIDLTLPVNQDLRIVAQKTGGAAALAAAEREFLECESEYRKAGVSIDAFTRSRLRDQGLLAFDPKSA